MRENVIFDIDQLIKKWDEYMLKGLPKPVVILFKQGYEDKRLEFIHEMIGKDKKYYLGKDSEQGIIVRINSLEHLKEIKKKLMHREQKYKDMVWGVKRYQPKMTTDRKHKQYKIRLMDFYDTRLNKKIIEEVKEKLNINNIHFEYKDTGVFQYLVISGEDIDKVNFLKNVPIWYIEPVYIVELS